MSKISFSFKDDEYTFKELFNMYLTKKKIYQSGEVINNSTGEVFDISTILNVKTQYHHLLNEITDTIGNEHDRRIKWAIEQEELNNRFKSLEKKYMDKDIKVEEMFEYLTSKKKFNNEFIKDRQMFSVKYDSFITLNIGEKLPNDLSFLDKGRFYEMLYYLAYSNSLQHTPRKNGRIIKKEDLMEVLKINHYKSYRSFISNLVKHNIIREVSTTNNSKVIIINPIYANRNIRIDYTTYIIFKKDIQNFLTEEEIYYLELIGNKDDLVDSYEIV